MRRLAGALAAVVPVSWAGGDPVTRGMPMSQAAHDYLEHALSVLEDNALDRYTVDWRSIRGAISAVGNLHTTLISPAEAVPPPPDRIPVPEGELLAGRFARLTVPGVSARTRPAEKYVSAGQVAVRRLNAAALCGWLVDLRSNRGGNMWPMLTVLVPLLGEGRLGAFVGPDGRGTPWEIRDRDVVLAGQVKGTNPQRLTFELSDGALLVVTGAVTADRTGHRHGTPITPDVPASTRTGDDVAAATTWLARRPGCA